MEDCNIKLPSVLSDTSGATGTELIDKLINGDIITMIDVENVYHHKLQASKEDIFETCQGLMTEHNIYLLQMVRRDTEFNERLIIDLDSRIREIIVKHISIFFAYLFADLLYCF